MTEPLDAAGRRLLYVPILQTSEDFGSMAEEARKHMSRALGAAGAVRRSAAIVAFWNRLRDRLCALPLTWGATRLYQDGLPVGGHELSIVKELAAKGSVNHMLLVELASRGAEVMGTEDPVLLLREYRRIQRLSGPPLAGAPAAEELLREGDDLLRERDEFIARRIDSTLRDGESAILFIGLLHRVDELLRGKLQIQSFRDSLPPGTEPWRKRRLP